MINVITTNNKNRLASILLLGGMLLGNNTLLKAAKYINPQQDAAECYSIFCQELEKRAKKEKTNPKTTYLLNSLNHPQDIFTQEREEAGKLMAEVLTDALKNSADQYAWYTTIRENIKQRILGPPTGWRRQKYQTTTEPTRTKKTTQLSFNMGYNHGPTLETTLKNFQLLGITFPEAEIKAGTKGIKATLEKAISDDIYTRIGLNLEDFTNLKINCSLTTGKRRKDWRGALQVQYKDKETLGMLSLTKEF